MRISDLSSYVCSSYLGDTAIFPTRRKQLRQRLDMLYRLVGRHRPIGAEFRILAIMDRRFGAQARHRLLPAVLAPQFGAADVERIGIFGGNAILGGHRDSSSLRPSGAAAYWVAERSEERRVGKECGSTCRSRRSQCHLKKNNT